MTTLIDKVSAAPASRDTGFAHAGEVMNLLPHAVLVVEVDGTIADANAAAESFFDMSRAMLKRHRLADIVPFASPLLSLLEQAAHRGAALNEYRVDLGNPKLGPDRVVDIHVSPMGDLRDRMMILLQERSIADKFDRQLTHRGAARSVSALAAMLAHEIKNPLSGIRGAAQLLETAVGDDDRALTQLICEETDRIVKLVDRMEAFSDLRPIERESVNIHAVLDRVKRIALAGFARHIRFVETYDPSLPPVFGNRDQLVQVFLNLVKNAAEALGTRRDRRHDRTDDGVPARRASQDAGSATPVSLPLEFCVRDNGPGVPSDIAAHLFDPFVTTKSSGTGLGLALVAKVIGDHGGTVECESYPRRTTFRVLLPMFAARDGRVGTTS